jgi:ribonuclease HII
MQSFLEFLAGAILAKVYRDQTDVVVAMEKYPEYGFHQHMGHPTKQHLEKLKI